MKSVVMIDFVYHKCVGELVAFKCGSRSPTQFIYIEKCCTRFRRPFSVSITGYR